MARVTVIGNVGNVGETKTGKTLFSVAENRGEETTWYTVIGEVEAPEVGDYVEVTGDLVVGEPYNGKSQVTVFTRPALRVFPKKTEESF